MALALIWAGRCWFLAVRMTKSAVRCCEMFEAKSVGTCCPSLSRKLRTFLYWTSFKTRYRSFSRSFWPMTDAAIVMKAFLAYARTSCDASFR